MVSVIFILFQSLGMGHEGLLPAQASAAFLQYLSSLLEAPQPQGPHPEPCEQWGAGDSSPLPGPLSTTLRLEEPKGCMAAPGVAGLTW